MLVSLLGDIVTVIKVVLIVSLAVALVDRTGMEVEVVEGVDSKLVVGLAVVTAMVS